MITKYLSVFSVLFLFMVSCSLPINPVDRGGYGSANIKVRAPAGSPFAQVARKAIISITANDMSSSSKELSVSSNAVEGVVNNIPSGKNRKFDIQVLDSNSDVKYRGSATADVPSDQTVAVPITLTRTQGNAVINGTIVDSIPVQLDSNVVALFKCNEGSGTILFDSVNGNDTAYDVSWAGTAMNFQNSYVQITNGERFNYPELTIEMVVTPSTFSAPVSYLFCKGNDAGTIDGSLLLFFDDKGRVAFCKQGLAQPHYVAIASKAVLTPGQRYYIAVTYKTGGTADIYINGVLDTANAASDVLSPNNDYRCLIGMHDNTNYPYFFNGSISDVCISKVQRSSAEILDRYFQN